MEKSVSGPTQRQLPKILLKDPSVLFLHARRRFVRATGREMGFAHLTRLLAQLNESWQSLPVEGPDGEALYLDLRAKEGYFNQGFANTTGHIGALLEFIEDGDVVFDVGANIGVWSRSVLARRRLSKLIAFEPWSQNFALLTKNLRGHTAVSCLPFAVGANTALARFSTDLGSLTNRVLAAETTSGSSVSVPMVTLDSWASENGIERLDVLKVDVEGAEADVFRGARELLRDHLPVVFFEYLDDPFENEGVTPESFAILSSLGYRIWSVLKDGTLAAVADRSKAPRTNDYIAVPANRATPTQIAASAPQRP